MPTADVNKYSEIFSKINLYNLLWAVLIGIICLIVIKYTLKLFKKMLSKAPLEQSLKNILIGIVKFVMYFISATFVAEIIGLPPTSIVTVIGTLGLAFSLAMQDSLSNIAGGILILYTNPFKPNDYISVSGTEGSVEKIGLIHTSLKTIDNKKIFIPNSSISKDKIINYSSEEQRQLEIIFSIGYECDTKKAKKVIENTVINSQYTEKNKDIFIRVWALSASSVDIIARLWVKKGDYIEAKCSLLEEVKLNFDKEGISIPYNQLDVHMVETNPSAKNK